MTIHGLTPGEAAQITTLKAWPIYSTHPHCSGPCDQGRSVCLTPEACQTGATQADNWEPLSLRDNLMFWVPVLTATAVVVAGLLRLVGVWSS